MTNLQLNNLFSIYYLIERQTVSYSVYKMLYILFFVIIYNSRLKELLNVNNLRSTEILKAKVFALLNCIALVSGTISVNVFYFTIQILLIFI